MRFKDFLQVAIAEDIKNIYCYDDAIGKDADYMFAFNCNEATPKKIIQVHKLAIDTMNTDNGFGMQSDFDWWDEDQIAKLLKRSWSNGEGCHKLYWYDIKNEKAYFFDFDL